MSDDNGKKDHPKQTVMVIDDSPFSLRVLGELLSGEGFRVRPFLSGVDALRALESEHPALILLDIRMPEMDGFEFCSRLKGNPELRDIPVIFISTLDETADKVHAFEVGGVDYVTKPIRPDEVLARVGVQLKLRRAQQQLEEQNITLESTLEQLKTAQSHLVQSEKMAALGMLSAGVAHEINNPLNYIRSSATTVHRKVNDLVAQIVRLEGTAAGGEAGTGDAQVPTSAITGCLELTRGLPDLAANIVDGAVRATDIVHGLSLFARVDRTASETADIHEGLDSTLNLLDHRLRGRVHVERDYGEIPKVTCYPGKLNQVFMNLLGNAVDAVEQADSYENRIVVRTRLEEPEDGPRIVIEIIDNGTGIPEASITQLFEPFYTTKPVGRGTGLGLSISHGIVQDHGGTLVAGNEPDGGARFTISLPVRESLGEAGASGE